MAVTNFTPLLGLALPTTGDLSGTWGTTVNDSITGLIDSAVAGTTTLSADADVTLSTNNGISNQARNAVLLWTASNSITRSITAPAQSKAYVVVNAGTGSIVVRGAGPTTGVTVLSGEKALVAWNGADFVKVSSTVSTATVASANGFAGSNTNGTLTLSTTVTGITKGNGTALSAATAGTDYLAPPTGTAILKANNGGALANAVAGTDYVAAGSPTIFTAKQTFNGSASVLAAVLANAAETVTVVGSPAGGTINFDVTTQSVLYYTSAATSNWTLNFRASSGASLDSALATGQAITLVFLATTGSPAYYASTIQIDGATVTPKYQGGIAPTFGTTNGIDAYTFTIIKTASATYTVLGSQVRFA